MKFRRISFILCMVLFLVSGISAYATECQLGVSLGEKGAEIELAMYKVAEVQENEYFWLPAYEGIKVDLADLNSAAETKAAAEAVYGWIIEKNINPYKSETTNEKGTASFTVGSGVYVIAKKSEKGFMAPVLFVLQENQSEKYLIISPKFTVAEEPDQPSNPNNPDNPDNPNNPENPDNPDNPNNPENPDNPDNPNNPENSDNPDNPNNPENSDNPNNPENTDNPENSDNSDNPSGAQTGDAENAIMWVVVLMAALAGVVVLTKKNFVKK